MKKILWPADAAALALAGCGQGATGGGGGDAARDQIRDRRLLDRLSVHPGGRRALRPGQCQFPPADGRIDRHRRAASTCSAAASAPSIPDVANASRRIKASELEQCNRNGVNQIIEIPVGIDGLALIEFGAALDRLPLTARDIYAALAANPFGRPQTARTWRDVNPALPDVPIRVYGPPPTSGTRDSFAELILDQGLRHRPGDGAR